MVNATEKSPRLLLEHLNQVVLGRTGGGCVSACCARIHSDGWLVIANTGHILPYLPGKELPVEGGMPLGIISDVTYSESSFDILAHRGNPCTGCGPLRLGCLAAAYWLVEPHLVTCWTVFSPPYIAVLMFCCAAGGIALLGITSSQELAFIAVFFIGFRLGA
jgi:hypothetical protein